MNSDLEYIFMNDKNASWVEEVLVTKVAWLRPRQFAALVIYVTDIRACYVRFVWIPLQFVSGFDSSGILSQHLDKA